MAAELVATGRSEGAPYQIRDFRSGDIAAVLALLRLSLGEGRSSSRTEEFWTWKHLANPFGRSLLLVADGQEILGLRAFMRWGFRTPAGAVHAVRPVDTSTHPAYRRLGIFSRLTEASLDRVRQEGVHLIFNTPNPTSMAGYLKLGWQPVERPRLLVRVLNPLRIARVAALRRFAPARVEGSSGVVSEAVPPAGAVLAHREVLAGLLERNDRLYAEGIRTARSTDFLQWRYVSPPSISYFALWAGTNPSELLLIFRPGIRNGLREILLSEVLAGREDARGLRRLVERLTGAVRADYLVAAATPGTAHWRMLRSAGFLPLPRMGPNFVVFPLSWPSGAPDPRRLANWRLALSDLEIF